MLQIEILIGVEGWAEGHRRGPRTKRRPRPDPAPTAAPRHLECRGSPSIPDIPASFRTFLTCFRNETRSAVAPGSLVQVPQFTPCWCASDWIRGPLPRYNGRRPGEMSRSATFADQNQPYLLQIETNQTRPARTSKSVTATRQNPSLVSQIQINGARLPKNLVL